MSAPEKATDHQAEIAARVKAIEAIMIEKGLMTTEAVDRLAEIYETRGRSAARRQGRRQGLDRPRVQGPTARERQHRVRGARDRRPAGRGHGGRRGHRRRPPRHRLHAVLLLPVAGAGPAPNWYKMPAYRAAMVHEPRKVLREEFGYERARDSVEIRVWDSSSELRYWVLPQRPGRHRGASASSSSRRSSRATR